MNIKAGNGNGVWRWIAVTAVVALGTTVGIIRASDLKPIEAHVVWSEKKNAAQDSSIARINTYMALQSLRDSLIITDLKEIKAMLKPDTTKRHK